MFRRFWPVASAGIILLLMASCSEGPRQDLDRMTGRLEDTASRFDAAVDAARDAVQLEDAVLRYVRELQDFQRNWRDLQARYPDLQEAALPEGVANAEARLSGVITKVICSTDDPKVLAALRDSGGW